MKSEDVLLSKIMETKASLGLTEEDALVLKEQLITWANLLIDVHLSKKEEVNQHNP